MKYINFKYAGYVIFEETQNHKDIAKRFPTDEVISAGTIKLYPNGEENPLGTFGESTSLLKKSEVADADWILRRLTN